MLQLNWWQQFIIGAAIALLNELETKITNPTEKAALQAAIGFLQSLMSAQLRKFSGPPC